MGTHPQLEAHYGTIVQSLNTEQSQMKHIGSIEQVTTFQPTYLWTTKGYQKLSKIYVSTIRWIIQ
jgi:hypothetical protein